MSTVHRAPRRALAALTLGLVLGLLSATLGPLAPARADVSRAAAREAQRSGATILCTGYAGCRDAGYSNAGYQAAGGQMYWRMYSGHNCTNYAAYRMVRSGLPNTRPWDGGGNAMYWGHYMSSITDDTPRVGAVAWWDAYQRPAGSVGHVAYVEQVISNDEIVVSQDSWGGDFSWARITRSSGSWPSGFVHFNDVPLENTAPPTVTGVTKVGGQLTASAGAWSPQATSMRYGYQWYAGSTAITGATAASYTLQPAQQGRRISVKVTASRPGYSTAAVKSPKTDYVLPGVISSTAAPAIEGGVATVDHELTVTAGGWDPAPDSVTYQWYADGQMLEGVTQSTYTPGPAQVGQALTVVTTASRVGYDPVTATSAATAPVREATFHLLEPPTLTGAPRLGRTLTVSPGSWSPTVADQTVVWLRDGEPIEGANGLDYTLTPDDLGHRVTARLTVTRAGYEDLVQTTDPLGPVRTETRIWLRASRPGPGRVTLRVAVTAPGLDTVPGVVKVLSHGQVLSELTLRGGRAAVALRHLPAGATDLRLVYVGGDTTVSSSLRRTVTVR
ncbi:MAG: CHAP domain-containing protein [Nocardioides sp.]